MRPNQITESRAYKLARDWIFVVLMSAVSALGLNFFVFKNDFAPAGVDGMATMLQSLTKWNAGYFSLIINIPLLVVGWFFINRKYVVYTLAFIMLNGGLLIVIPYLDIHFEATWDNEALDALFAGIILGFRAAVLLRIGGSSGGLDIIAELLHKKFGHISFVKVLFILNIIIVSSSFFVYGSNLYPIMLSTVYCFVYSYIINIIMRGPKSALEFTVITEEAEELIKQIINRLKHGVTVIPAQGGYTGEKKQMLKCIVNKREIAEFKRVLKNFDNTFCYITEINEVTGNFRRGRWEQPK
jgi:uncharacterized membrane-anchored protein YitT (DUF2179 family)